MNFSSHLRLWIWYSLLIAAFIATSYIYNNVESPAQSLERLQGIAAEHPLIQLPPTPATAIPAWAASWFMIGISVATFLGCFLLTFKVGHQDEWLHEYAEWPDSYAERRLNAHLRSGVVAVVAAGAFLILPLMMLPLLSREPAAVASWMEPRLCELDAMTGDDPALNEFGDILDKLASARWRIAAPFTPLWAIGWIAVAAAAIRLWGFYHKTRHLIKAGNRTEVLEAIEVERAIQKTATPFKRRAARKKRPPTKD